MHDSSAKLNAMHIVHCASGKLSFIDQRNRIPAGSDPEARFGKLNAVEKPHVQTRAEHAKDGVYECLHMGDRDLKKQDPATSISISTHSSSTAIYIHHPFVDRFSSIQLLHPTPFSISLPDSECDRELPSSYRSSWA